MSQERLKKEIGLLGYEATDGATKLSGVVTSVSFDLAGCVMGYLQPRR